MSFGLILRNHHRYLFADHFEYFPDDQLTYVRHLIHQTVIQRDSVALKLICSCKIVRCTPPTSPLEHRSLTDTFLVLAISHVVTGVTGSTILANKNGISDSRSILESIRHRYPYH
jgi:hypothetical protein